MPSDYDTRCHSTCVVRAAIIPILPYMSPKSVQILHHYRVKIFNHASSNSPAHHQLSSDALDNGDDRAEETHRVVFAYVLYLCSEHVGEDHWRICTRAWKLLPWLLRWKADIGYQCYLLPQHGLRVSKYIDS